MNFDTRDPKAMLKIDHGCIEGLPCTPPAAALYNAAGSNGGGGGGGIPDVHPHIDPEDDGTTVDVGSSVVFILLILFLGTLSLCMCCMNCRLRRELKSVHGRDDGSINDDSVDNVHEQFNYRGGVLQSDDDVGQNTDAVVENSPPSGGEPAVAEENDNNHPEDEHADSNDKMNPGDQMQERGDEAEPLIESTDNEIV